MERYPVLQGCFAHLSDVRPEHGVEAAVLGDHVPVVRENGRLYCCDVIVEIFVVLRSISGEEVDVGPLARGEFAHRLRSAAERGEMRRDRLVLQVVSPERRVIVDPFDDGGKRLDGPVRIQRLVPPGAGKRRIIEDGLDARLLAGIEHLLRHERDAVDSAVGHLLQRVRVIHVVPRHQGEERLILRGGARRRQQKRAEHEGKQQVHKRHSYCPFARIVARRSRIHFSVLGKSP